MRRPTIRLFALCAALASCADRPGPPAAGAKLPAAERADDVTFAPGREALIVVVRHAEKSDQNPTDPPLSAEGQQRAQALAGVLADAKVSAIYTSQFARAKQTAAPLAQAQGVAITERPVTEANLATYSADLVREIRANHRGQTVLVVSHSNTVPEIVGTLAGVAVAPIGEGEYSRLYAVTFGTKIGARVVAARY